jgi:hypothetical protein
MDECIDSLEEAVIFTTLDCNSGDSQIPVHPADREKTTFTSHFGIYQFLRLPFGLRNVPATFNAQLISYFPEFIGKHVWFIWMM